MKKKIKRKRWGVPQQNLVITTLTPVIKQEQNLMSRLDNVMCYPKTNVLLTDRAFFLPSSPSFFFFTLLSITLLPFFFIFIITITIIINFVMISYLFLLFISFRRSRCLLSCLLYVANVGLCGP